jgi:hypothetical protein
LRIATGVAVLWVLWDEQPWRYAALPRSAMVDIVGREFIDWLPTSSVAIAISSALLGTCCALLIVGIYSREAAGIATALAIWVLGIPQLFTGPNHYHHLVWLLILLAVAGGDEVWAVRPTRTSIDPEWWLRSALALIGIAYLFPGIAKARQLPEWVTTDSLQNIILIRRFQGNETFGFIPPEWMIHAFAIGVIALEVSFIVLAFTRFRWAAIAAALAFHIGAGIVMGIWFFSLILVLPAFFFSKPRRPRGSPPSGWVGGVVAIVIALAALAGISGVADAWPFAHYPPFDRVTHAPVAERTYAIIDGQQVEPGDVLLPYAREPRQRKFETTHSTSELAELLEARLERPVEVIRVNVDVDT